MNLKVYRKFVNTSNRRRILIRPMVADDRNAVVDMFKQASDDDLRFLYEDVRDETLVASWFESLDYDRVLPLLALHNNTLIGDATLHRHTGGGRHTGELRIFLTRDFRGVGLGSLLLKELIQIAGALGLRYLLARVVSEQVSVVKAFRKLGFKRQAELDDFFMESDGTLHDVSMMIYSLAGEQEYTF
ncbi:MAG: GNAT family N-acetyltransferase [Deltaproteobacteria bacterium]|nr:GNAT family N-acetyltransferase [Candidatus Anaeroferrophillus wilburensis]MBN2888377.1 GNAT family N-acetyltransferase [Deltaproteobacteria bacterium]